MKASEVLEAVRVALVGASGLPDALVQLDATDQNYAGLEGVTLSLRSFTDESGPRYVPGTRTIEAEDPEDPPVVIETITVSRVSIFALSVRVETVSNLRDGDALDIAHRTVSGLHFPAVREALVTAGVVPVRLPNGAAIQPSAVDGRALDVLAFDVDVRAEIHDTRDGTIETIGAVEVDGTLTPGPITFTVSAGDIES